MCMYRMYSCGCTCVYTYGEIYVESGLLQFLVKPTFRDRKFFPFFSACLFLRKNGAFWL